MRVAATFLVALMLALIAGMLMNKGIPVKYESMRVKLVLIFLVYNSDNCGNTVPSVHPGFDTLLLFL